MPKKLALVLLISALHARAADLRPIREPAKLATLFAPRARVRVVNVWAMWCVPCVEELPDFRALDEAFGAEVAFAGVSLDDMLPGASAKPVASLLDRHRIAFPNAYYTGNADALADYLKFDGAIPITIVYDATGKELWRHQGRIDRTEIIARLRDFLRRKR